MDTKDHRFEPKPWRSEDGAFHGKVDAGSNIDAGVFTGPLELDPFDSVSAEDA